MMRVRIGALDTEVTLKNIARTKTAAGGFTTARTGALTDWAQVRPATAREEEHARRREQRINYVVTMRWREDVIEPFGLDSELTFLDRAGRTRTLQVKTLIDPDEEGRWLVLGCLEGGP